MEFPPHAYAGNVFSGGAALRVAQSAQPGPFGPASKPSEIPVFGGENLPHIKP